MNHQPHRFLPLLFVCISFFSTAFMLNSSAVAVEAPPQYNAPKMTFFERFMLKRAVKKLEKQEKEPTDLDKTVKDVKKLGATSLLSALSLGPALYLSSALGLGGGTVVLIVVILLLVAIISGISVQVKAQKVLENGSSNAQQKQIAQKGRNEGICGLIVAGIVVALFLSILGSF